MKSYLDTNALRQLSNIPDRSDHELLCSQLGIFELISGMSNASEYKIRRIALMRIIQRNLTIIWESPSTLQAKAFSLDIEDYDVEAIRHLMEKIIKTENFSEAQDIAFELGGNTYTLKTFARHDNNISEESVALLTSAIDSTKPEQRKALAAIDLTRDMLLTETYKMIDNFLCNYFERFSPPYFKALNHYLEKKPLSNYFRCLTYRILVIMRDSSPTRENDAIDIAHLAYTDDVDYFVSDDRFYRKLDQSLFDVKFITIDDFINMR
ncbi:hypothetical protein N5I28_02795 [Pseudomonas mosselii]|uniref:hypothetical protein n=1 Tax=Pseudomonas mosselii TaxID=78327 RepID=UPI0024477806|nr:hypothetical protein [Pseudomonas mosselii]MDH1508680.1 hypothetical protein [Pseudomonas mosselii]